MSQSPLEKLSHKSRKSPRLPVTVDVAPAVKTAAEPAAQFNWHEALPGSTKLKSRRSGRVTINDVAIRVGVDKSAVSLALRGDDRISTSTRERVMQAARDLGYVPNNFARSLSGGRSRVIGVMLTDLSNRYFAGPLEEFQLMAEPLGFTLSVKFSSWDPERERRGIYQFCEGWVEGIIWAPSEANSPRFADLLTRIELAKIPVVAMGHIQMTNSVGVDLESTVRTGLEYLRNLGHRNIGVACATLVTGWRAKLQTYRLATMRRVAQELGITILDQNVFDSSNNSYGGVEVAAQLVRRPKSTWPTALFTADDMIGQALVAGLTALGVTVPREISILGMDNAPGDLDGQLPLTTVSLEASETGRRAIEFLMEMIDRKTAPFPLRNISLPPRVIERKTCLALA